MPALMGAGNVKLLISHINTRHMPLRPDKLRQRIDIAPRATAQIKHPRALEHMGHHEPTAIVAHQDFVMHLGEHPLHILRHVLRATAGVGLQVRTALQHFSIIILNRFVLHSLSPSSICLTGKEKRQAKQHSPPCLTKRLHLVIPFDRSGVRIRLANPFEEALERKDPRQPKAHIDNQLDKQR